MIKISKKFLFTIAIIYAFNTMPCQSETTDMVKQALEDFKFDPEKISITVENDSKFLGRAFLHPNGQKKISINEENTKNLDLRRFIAYHEVAHFVDIEREKKLLPITCATISTITSSIGLTILNKILKRTKITSPKAHYFVLGASFPIFCAISTNRVIKYRKSQEENRTNILACQQLLKRNSISPITNYLCHSFDTGISRDEHDTHAELKIRKAKFDEYQKIKKFMERNQFIIKTQYNKNSGGILHLYYKDHLIQHASWKGKNNLLDHSLKG